MNELRRSRWGRGVLVGVLVSSVFLGGGVRAEHSDPNEVHACVKEKQVDGGTTRKITRLVSDPALCKPPPKETVVEWNKLGPQGPAGQAGEDLTHDVSTYCTLLAEPLVSYAPCAQAGESIFTVDDPANDVGQSTSIAVGTDGFPVISYFDNTDNALKVAKCNDAACAGVNETITTVDDPANAVGRYTSVAVGTDGFPVISYQDFTADTLKVAKCNDAACAGANETITTVDDPANVVGFYTSIAVGTDGFPVISYHDFTAGALKVAKCNDAACAGANETITTVDGPAFVGFHTSIAVGTDGNPVISYQDGTAGALKVAKCNDAACAGANETITTVDDPANFVGYYTSIAVGTDGNPVISYHDGNAVALKVAKCNDAACAGANETITTVDDPAVNNVGSYSSIAVGTDGNPVVGYLDNTAFTLKVTKCNDAACAGANETITTVDDPAVNNVGSYSSIAVGTDGNPVISYQDFTANTLKVARVPG